MFDSFERKGRTMHAVPAFSASPLRLRKVRLGAAIGTLAIVSALQLSVPVPVAAHTATAAAISWMETHQDDDGALAGLLNGYTVGGTADGVLALAAAGPDPSSIKSDSGHSAADYLEAHAADGGADGPKDGAGLAGKVAIAATLSGRDPHEFGRDEGAEGAEDAKRVDLGNYIKDHYDPSSGAFSGYYGPDVYNHSLAVLGLISMDMPVPDKAVEYLVGRQQPDGGWEATGPWGSDTNGSALAVQALAALEPGGGTGVDAPLEAAIGFFREQQNPDGGFAYQKSTAANWCEGERVSESDSTGLSIQALMALGEDPAGAGWTTAGSATPLTFLSQLQNGDGSFSYQEGNACAGNGASTSAAIQGLEQKSLVCLIGQGTCPPKADVELSDQADTETEAAQQTTYDTANSSSGDSSEAADAGSVPAMGQSTSGAAKLLPKRPSTSAVSTSVASRGSTPAPVPAEANSADMPEIRQRSLSKEAEAVTALTNGSDKKDPPYVPVAGGLAAVGLLAGSITNQLCRPYKKRAAS